MTLVHRDLVRLGFRQMLRAPKTWAALAVSCIPLLAGIILLFTDGAMAARYGAAYSFDPMLTEWLMLFMLGGTMPLVALLMAGGSLADEAQDRTLTYLLVRPIPRASLYVSRSIPVVTATALLGMFQALSFGLLRLMSLGINAPGTRLLAGDGSITYSAASVLWMMIPVGMLAAALCGAVYAALFALVSLGLQRFHFLANLLIYLVWELPFGNLGVRGLGFFTVLAHGRSILLRADPTIDYTDGTVPLVFAVVWLAAWAVAWVAAGAWAIRRLDFHVTSATT